MRRNAIRAGWRAARISIYFLGTRARSSPITPRSDGAIGARGGCFRLRYILQKSAKHFYEPLSYLLWKALCSQIVPGPGPLYTNKMLKYILDILLLGVFRLRAQAHNFLNVSLCVLIYRVE